MAPGDPTIKRMSAIRSLLNIAAFLSRTVGLEACQFGSRVPGGPTGETQGLAGGEPGALAGCITCRLSLCETTWGGDRLRDPLLSVSAIRNYLLVSRNWLKSRECLYSRAIKFIFRTSYCEFKLSTLDTVAFGIIRFRFTYLIFSRILQL